MICLAREQGISNTWIPAIGSCPGAMPATTVPCRPEGSTLQMASCRANILGYSLEEQRARAAIWQVGQVVANSQPEQRVYHAQSDIWGVRQANS